MPSPLAIRPDMQRSDSTRPSRRLFVHSEDSASNIRRASVAPTIRERPNDNEDVESFERRDDEHKARDRGEALIRHRMRERKREKLKKQRELGNELGRSYTPESVDSQMRGSQANSVMQSHDYFPDSMRSPKSMRRPEPPASTQGDDTMNNDDDDEHDENEVPFDDDDEEHDDEEHGDEDDDEDLEYTLKDRQDALNFEHPFGLPIWKPALYKKSRSITRTADSALKCMPGQDHGSKVLPGNIFWFIFFGIWLGVLCFILSGLLRLVPRGGAMYSRVLYGLATYIMWPFGNYVELECTHQSGDRHGPCHWAHIHEHDVKDDDSDKTLNANNEPEESTLLVDGASSSKNPSYGSAPCNEDDADEDDTPPTEEERIASERGVYHYVYDDHGSDVGVTKRWAGIIVYAIVYSLILFPVLGLVCLLCWGLVVTIPMAKLTWVLMKNMATQPLAMHFRSPLQIDTTVMRVKGADDGDAGKGVQYPLRAGQVAPRLKAKHRKKGTSKRRSVILLCNYRAVGKEYFKYTVGGVNILFINTLPIVFFTIFAFFLLRPFLKEHDIVDGLFPWITSDGMIFFLSLCSVLPLSYFIGMAVASISTQSSIGMGAVINATFGSIIELLLYSIALVQGRAGLVEGSLIGSILAGVLLMPGLSMCSGATRRKEQKFNAQSAGVTSTMLIMAIIGILTPTIFYQIYGTFELQCSGCPDRTHGPEDSWMCRQCSYEHLSPVKDPFFQTNVKGLIYLCAVVLILAYGIGLWFSLRTHASQIWNNAQPVPQTPANAMPEHMPPGLHRASVYKRMMPAHVMQQLLPSYQKRDASQDTQDARRAHDAVQSSSAASEAPHEESWRLPPAHEPHEPHQQGAREGEQGSKKASAEDAVAEAAMRMYQYIFNQQKSAQQPQPVHDDDEDEGAGGHDAPSWSRMTALSVLLGCTVLYAIIAEILVDVVDVVVKGSGLPEKFIGVTIFALVPNTTEFMNAMSFAINGNIALSLEIGSAYVLQVCLIQIPVLVGFSAWYNSSHSFPPGTIEDHMFTLIFPRWDIIAILLSIFLLTYTYIEARSNYHRGSILIFAYLVFVAGFFFAPSHDPDAFIPGTKPGVMSWVLS